MYCSGCGQSVDPNLPACAQCGRPLPAAAPYVASGFIPYNRVQRHVQTLAVLWLAFSLLTVLGWLIALPFLHMAFGHGWGSHGWTWDGPVSLHWLLPFITIAIYLRAALGALVGIGLLRRERWARVLAIVVGVLVLIKPPFGTALGIYTLWVLAPAQSGMEYDMVAAP